MKQFRVKYILNGVLKSETTTNPSGVMVALAQKSLATGAMVASLTTQMVS